MSPLVTWSCNILVPNNGHAKVPITLQVLVHPTVRNCTRLPNLLQGGLIPSDIWYLLDATGSISSYKYSVISIG